MTSIPTTVAEARTAFERAVTHGEGNAAHAWHRLCLAEAATRPGSLPGSYAEAVDRITRQSAAELADELRRERERAETAVQAEVLEGPIVAWFVSVGYVGDGHTPWETEERRHADLEAVGRVAWCRTERTSVAIWSPTDPMFLDGRPNRVRPGTDNRVPASEELARAVMAAEEEKGAILDQGEALRLVWPEKYAGRDLNPKALPAPRVGRRGASVVAR